MLLPTQTVHYDYEGYPSKLPYIVQCLIPQKKGSHLITPVHVIAKFLHPGSLT